MVRTLLTALLLITLLSPKTGYGQEQQFVVVNRVPQFQVTNKVAAPTLPTDPSQPAPAGYRWVKRGDGPWKLERDVPGVAVPKGNTFRDAHDCPACGRRQTTVDGFNRDGTHRHRCVVDGTVWSH